MYEWNLSSVNRQTLMWMLSTLKGTTPWNHWTCMSIHERLMPVSSRVKEWEQIDWNLNIINQICDCSTVHILWKIAYCDIFKLYSCWSKSSECCDKLVIVTLNNYVLPFPNSVTISYHLCILSLYSPQLCSHEVDHLEVGRDVAGGGEAVVAPGELGRDGVGGHGAHDLAAG